MSIAIDRRLTMLASLSLLLAACASGPEPRAERTTTVAGAELVSDPRQAMGESLQLAGESFSSETEFDDSERFPGTGVFVNPDAVRPRQPSPDDGEITFNFEGQGIQEVVHAVLHHMLGENYVISPGVSGQVTFSTARPLTQAQVMPVLEMLLRWNGATLVWREGKYHVVPIAEALPGNLIPRFDALETGRGYEVQVVPLKYLAPSRMAEILQPYARQDAVVNADDTRGLLFIAGTRFELRNYRQMIDTFDVDWLAGMSVGMFSLTRIEVDDLLPELEAVLGEGGDTPLAGMFRFIPLGRLNALMVITPNEHYLNEAERWIRRLDRSSPEAGARLYVYRVKNLEADVLAGYLSEIFNAGGGSGRAVPSRRDRGEIAPGMERAEVSSVREFQGRQREQPATSRGTSEGGLVIGNAEDVRVTAVAETNSLLIQASPAQYDAILSAITRLDEEPLQVLVEAQVLIVELNDSLRYGVSWFLAHRDSEIGSGARSEGGDNGGSSDGLPSAFSPTRGGNTLVFGSGTDMLGTITRRNLSRTFVAATIDALESVSDVRTISSPSLMVRNNSSASINVGRQVPVQSTRFIGGTTDASTIGNVQFISTGVTLNVTPRVNPGGLVYLDISQEVSSPGDEGVGGNPIINTRTVTTEVAVQSGQTILLGGLIEDTELQGRSGVPGLQRVPGVGALFRSTRNSSTRAETLVLITPTVIESIDRLREVSDDLTRQFRGLEPLRVRVETP